MTVPSRLGGTNWPALRTLRKRSSTAACASGVRLVTMSSVKIWRAKGGGFSGSGCFAAVASPSTSEAGTARSSIGNSGLPVSRSNRYTWPDLVICATASTAAAITLDRHQVRRRGKIAIPDVVVDRLKMPHALAGVGLQREQRVGEQVVALAIRAVEIECRRTGGDEDQAALFVEAHAGPVVGRADVLPGVLGPGVVAEFAGMRNGVERPADLAGADVVGADVAGRGGQRLADDAAHDQQVLVDDAGVVAEMDISSGGRPRPWRRSTRPSSPNAG